jgi:anti-sigma regulatory factor (Ser/Thr protein kinase)
MTMGKSHNTHFRNYYTSMSGNTLYFHNLTNPRVVPEFIFSVNRLIKKFGHKEIVLDFENAGYAYAYPITTIVGIIHYLKNKYDVKFLINAKGSYFYNLGILDQYSADYSGLNCLNKIWSYNNSDEVNIITTKMMKSIRRYSSCTSGVLDTCEWGLCEVLDNVVIHSEIKQGFVMGSVNAKNEIINICVFDYGIGIYNSLSKSSHRPKNETDAITLAIKEGVTSGAGQGYGLAGLMKIIQENDGGLTILSGKGGLKYRKRDQKVFSFEDIVLFDKDHPSTTVNFYLKTNNKVSVEDTIGKNYTNIELEKLENDKDEIVFKIKDQALGTATRPEAEKIRNEIINIFHATRQTVIIDFSGVAIISSSFADELIAKMISKFGFIQFQKIFKILNTNFPIRSIIDKAIEKRMSK